MRLTALRDDSVRAALEQKRIEDGPRLTPEEKDANAAANIAQLEAPEDPHRAEVLLGLP